MPKSRKRRTKSSNRKRRASQRRGDPLQGMGAEEFSRHIAALKATDDAERRGDAVGALDLMAQHSDRPGFWRPWRLRALAQMAVFGPMLPRWATSRWILAQALQQLNDLPGGGEARRVHRALEKAIELRGGRPNLPGWDSSDALCKVMDNDWVFRQLHLYEFGGLQHFLATAASADLVAGADRIHEWAASPMGGYRLLAGDTSTVTWQDLAREEPVVTANIGSATLVVTGECVIGRLVPIDAGTMFESAPLVAPEALARRVALDPSSWFDALRSAPGLTEATGLLAPAHGSGLLSDVPGAVCMVALSDAGGLDQWNSLPTPEALVKASLQLARTELDRLGLPRDDDGIDPWACLAAALLCPTLAEPLADIVGPEDREVLVRLGELLAEPAASWCRVLAKSLAQAA
jgi:hypothetical protein